VALLRKITCNSCRHSMPLCHPVELTLEGMSKVMSKVTCTCQKPIHIQRDQHATLLSWNDCRAEFWEIFFETDTSDTCRVCASKDVRDISHTSIGLFCKRALKKRLICRTHVWDMREILDAIAMCETLWLRCVTHTCRDVSDTHVAMCQTHVVSDVSVSMRYGV